MQKLNEIDEKKEIIKNNKETILNLKKSNDELFMYNLSEIDKKNKELIEMQLLLFSKDKEIEKLNDNYDKKIKNYNDYISILWNTIYSKDKELTTFKKIEEEEKEQKQSSLICSICLEDISDETKIETLCNHIFHLNCLDKWQNNTCPNCRSFL
jgi:hypothetical protein